MARPSSGSNCARHAAAGHNGHNFFVCQPAHRGTVFGGVCDFCSRWISWLNKEIQKTREIVIMLDVQNLTKNFGGFIALSGIDLNVQPGERLGLIGPNGSGKTTLINCVSGTIQDYEGEVYFNGENVNNLVAHKRARRGISRSFQIPKPFTSMTVKQNLLIPLEYAVNNEQLDGLSIHQQADQILETLDLNDKSDQLTSGLTQIEMRKLELARAMALKPKLLISDEAMAGLSSSEVDDILKILIELNENTKITIIMIEHIMRAVMSFSERVVCLDAGKIIANGTPDQVIKNTEVEKAYLGE